MAYRINLILHFDNEDISLMEQARDLLLPLYNHAIVINEGEVNEERGFIQLEHCNHDIEPTQPCELLARWEVGRGRVYP